MSAARDDDDVVSRVFARCYGPFTRNVVMRATYHFVDETGVKLNMTPATCEHLFRRLAFQLGGSLHTSRWPALTFQLIDPAGTIPMCRFAIFEKSDIMSITGPIDYTTLAAVVKRFTAFLLQANVHIRMTNMHINNILATVNLPGVLDLERVAIDPDLLPNYNPRLIGHATYRPLEGGPTCLLWPRRIVIMGDKCVNAKNMCDAVHNVIRRVAPYITLDPED